MPRSNSDLASSAPSAPDVGEDQGRAPQQVDPHQARKRYSWIRFDNSEPAREARRQIQKVTREAANASGYRLDGRTIHLEYVQATINGSQRLAPSLRNLSSPSGSGRFGSTELTRHRGLVLDAAQELNVRHRDSVAVVSAASAYHCGGGFLTGGRHALEEAMCVQTTLFESIYREERRYMQSLDGKASDTEFVAYIPVDGVVCTPKVEVFRGGSDEGYPFMEKPTLLGAVISVAMYNCNPTIRDAPMDAPVDPETYREGVRAKFRSVLAAAVQARCSALVMADAGCGVYKNDPTIVGEVFGDLLRREFWSHIKEVAICGMPQWQEAVVAAVGNAGNAKLPSQGPMLEIGATGKRLSYQQPSSPVQANDVRATPPPPPPTRSVLAPSGQRPNPSVNREPRGSRSAEPAAAAKYSRGK